MCKMHFGMRLKRPICSCRRPEKVPWRFDTGPIRTVFLWGHLDNSCGASVHSVQRDTSEMTRNSSNFVDEMLHYLRVLWPWSILHDHQLLRRGRVFTCFNTHCTPLPPWRTVPCQESGKSRPVTHSAIVCPHNDVALKHSSQSHTQAHKVFDQSADLTQMSNCFFFRHQTFAISLR